MDDLVLIADDDRDIVRLMEINLQMDGFRVATAHDGEEALTKALALAPNLVLLDVMMPRMDGFEVCQRLRGDARTAHLPVIMLTAKSLSTDKVLGLTAGADDYIIKPFDPADLVERVKSTLERAREQQNLSPVSGLPPVARVEDEVAKRLRSGAPVAVAAADLDHFATFNQRYGNERGDQVIALAAQVLRRALEDTAGSQGLVGHAGADDFLAVLPPGIAEEFASRAVAGFDMRLPSLYDAPDAAAKAIELGEGGSTRQVPLVSISLGIADTATSPSTTAAELITAASERRDAAKQTPGSAAETPARGTPRPDLSGPPTG
jgi:diguanylate cyclase (GGDEF)-like protein